MSKSQRLRCSDLIAVYRLIGECRDLWYDSHAWRSHLLTRLCARLGAEAGVGGEIQGYLTDAPVKPARLIDLGWGDPKARASWQQFFEQEDPFVDPFFSQVFTLFEDQGGLVTRIREQAVSNRAWYKSRYYNEYPRVGKVNECLYSYFARPRNGEDVIDIIELHRSQGDPPFGERDRQIVEWLHGELGPMIGRQLLSLFEPATSELSPRLRQVLDCLLEGDSEKQAACQLALSVSTVHEYVTLLYRHFGVCSRAELLARWVRFQRPQ